MTKPFGRARVKCGQILRHAGPVMNATQDDFADRIGRYAATVFLVLLAILFAYGYLRPLL